MGWTPPIFMGHAFLKHVLHLQAKYMNEKRMQVVTVFEYKRQFINFIH